MSEVNTHFTEDMLKLIGLRSEYYNLPLSRSLEALGNQKYVGYVNAFIAGRVKGLFIFGINGCGKTSLVSAIVWKMIHDRIPCLIVSMDEVVKSFKANNWTIPVRFVQPDVLVIEELGKESDRTTGTGILESLLKARFENGRSCILTSNMVVETVGDLYSPTVLSMIVGNCCPVSFPEVDYRLKNPAQNSIKK